MNCSTVYAAIDLGSNSFHMIIAEEDSRGHLKVLDSLRDTVRLAAGLTASGDISSETTERALVTLAKFGQRLREFSSNQVRCVGTNTLRHIHPSAGFIEKAEEALGHPIDIIAGREEARLIYLGTTHSAPPVAGNQLVIDIGGGSTELIIGADGVPQTLESTHMGCVTLTQRFFANGYIDSAVYQQAVTEARRQLRPYVSLFRKQGWQSALGCSGTIKAVESILQANYGCDHGIQKSALKRLRRGLLAAGHVDNIQLSGLRDERRAVLVGGIAVLDAIFKDLRLENLEVSQSSLREGLLYDLVGRTHKEDIRDQSVTALMHQYNVDIAHAKRVKRLSRDFFNQVAATWKLTEEHARLLLWAAQLCEVGLSISHAKYHRHSEYILKNADLPGFSWQEQSKLAALVRLHRSKFNLLALEQVPKKFKKTLVDLAVLLRLAALFHRSRSQGVLSAVALQTDRKKQLTVAVDRLWLVAHPLTAADLEAEVIYHQTVDHGFTLQVQIEPEDDT